jgi:hypothetical protein
MKEIDGGEAELGTCVFLRIATSRTSDERGRKEGRVELNETRVGDRLLASPGPWEGWIPAFRRLEER